MTGSKGGKDAARERYQQKIDGLAKTIADLPNQKAEELVIFEEQWDARTEELEVLKDHYEAKLAVLDAPKKLIKPKVEPLPQTEPADDD